ncbi:MAG: 2-oxoacid:ferredoxin oxidoreductase subunit beta [Proteobacteria bacterium]|nr:2-oxoacid:ferredoxin oxidoreductase subunit beta [Pseudomonadota bacterium]
MATPAVKSSKSFYRSSNAVRWCSGCGDFHVLNALTSAWASLGLAKEKITVISGIGCSSRLPYYTSTYGFHTIHGRAPTVAMGLKITRPDLSVWIVTGDGDGLSIGGNHFIHLARRNPNITLLLFNNEIYGLTKGQASPTSKPGLNTKSTPGGALEQPINALSLAITSGASFVARVIDTDLPMMRQIFQDAHNHQGLSVVEILTTCVVFNEQAFKDVESRGLRAKHTLELRQGKPLIMGEKKDQTLTWPHHFSEPTITGLSSLPSDRIIHHDPSQKSIIYSLSLAELKPPKYPIATGILRQVEGDTYESLLAQRNNENYQTLDEILGQNSFIKGTG